MNRSEGPRRTRELSKVGELMSPKTRAALDRLNRSASTNKVLVISIHTNSTEFAELQHRLLKANMLEPFDFAVALDDVQGISHLDLGRPELDEHFERLCTSLDIPLIRIPGWVHADRTILFPETKEEISGDITNLRAADALQYVFNIVPWRKYDSVLLLDADMFPIRTVTKPDLSRDIPLFAVFQKRSRRSRAIKYFWNGIFWISSEAPLSHLLNFDCVKDKGLRADTGGRTFHLLEAYSRLGLKIDEMQHLPSGCWGPEDAKVLKLEPGIVSWLDQDYRRREDGNYHAELYDDRFLHYRGGSNWSQSDASIEIQNRKRLAEASKMPQN